MIFAGRLIAFLALACLAGSASAQTPPQIAPVPPARVPAPSTDTATGLIFPPAIAGIPQTQSIDYAQSFDRPDVGYSWTYAKPGVLSATVYVGSGKETTIAPGPASLRVAGELQQAIKDIYDTASQNRYGDVAIARGPEDCKAGAHVFRCTTLTAVTAKDRLGVFLQVMVTGYKNRFLKLRLEWLRSAAASQQARDRFVQAFEQTMER